MHPGIVETPLWRHMWSQGSCFGGLFSMLSRLSIFGVKTAAQASSSYSKIYRDLSYSIITLKLLPAAAIFSLHL